MTCRKSVSRHEQHQEAKAPIPSSVEQVACDGQEPFPCACLGKHPMENVNRAEKGDELKRDEVHGSTLSSTNWSPNHWVYSARPSPWRWSKSYHSVPRRNPARSCGSSPMMQGKFGIAAQNRRA